MRTDLFFTNPPQRIPGSNCTAHHIVEYDHADEPLSFEPEPFRYTGASRTFGGGGGGNGGSPPSGSATTVLVKVDDEEPEIRRPIYRDYDGYAKLTRRDSMPETPMRRNWLLFFAVTFSFLMRMWTGPGRRTST